MKPLSRAEAGLFRLAGRFLSPGGASGALLVLIYHRVLDRSDPLLPDEPDRAAFGAQMDLVRSLFNVLDLADAIERLRNGTLPPRAAAITFDDGYANNAQIAAPIMAARGLPATFFIATGFLDGGRMFNDTVIESVRRAPAALDLTDLELGSYTLNDDAARRQAISALLSKLKYQAPERRLVLADSIAERVGGGLPTDLMMTREQLRALAAVPGMKIGAHTINHPILTKVGNDAAQAEIVGSKQELERITGRPVETFAYPNGRPKSDYDPSHVDIVSAAGFRAAVSTAWGSAHRGSDRFQIPRVAPWDRVAMKYAVRLLAAYRQAA
jgi:peptidoglycan/xylan/chitin deacetylase (PgdA/CDA1 family)